MNQSHELPSDENAREQVEPAGEAPSEPDRETPAPPDAPQSGAEVEEEAVEAADQEPPASVSVLQGDEPEQALPETPDAIGEGPTDLVEVPVEQEEPLPGLGDEAPSPTEPAAEEPAAEEPAADEPAAEEPVEAASAQEAVEVVEAVEAIDVEAVEAEMAERGVAAPEAEAVSPTRREDEAVPDVAVAAAKAEQTVEAAAEALGEEAEPDTVGRDPFRGPGDWYVVHTYAGYENKVKTNLESRIHTMQMEDKIFDVHIPMEDVMEIKGGKKQVVQRKVFPGYLLVKMIYDNDSWYVVRNTPGVTGFVAAGTGSKPTPLSKREVEKILAVKKEEVKPQFRLGFEEGDVVRIISGPFADFNGTISEINLDQSKLKVLVNIFDRETPVELSFDQVAKV
jgi:transcriptional antiterminator NusG